MFPKKSPGLVFLPISILVMVIMVIPEYNAVAEESPRIKFLSPPVKVQVDGRIYELGWTKEIDPGATEKKQEQKFLTALDSKGNVVQDPKVLEKIFFVEYVYRPTFKQGELPIGPVEIGGVKKLEEYRSMQQLADITLFLREAGVRALVQAGKVYVTGGSSAGASVAEKIAEKTAVHLAKSIITNPTVYLKGTISLVFEDAVSRWKRAEALFLKTKGNSVLKYEDAKKIHDDLSYGRSYGTESMMFLAKLTLQEGGGGDLLSQLQKVKEYAESEIIAEVKGLYKKAPEKTVVTLISMGLLGEKLNKFLVNKVPIYLDYVQNTKSFYGLLHDYKESEYWNDYSNKHMTTNLNMAKLTTKPKIAERLSAEKPSRRKTSVKLIHQIPETSLNNLLMHIGNLRVSPNGRRIAYRCVGEKESVVIDGKEGKQYDRVWGIRFSPDSRRFAYAAKQGKNQLLVVDGREHPQIGAAESIAFSPDGNRIAYKVDLGNRDYPEVFVVVDGLAQKHYSDVSEPTFSPDGKQLAYVARRGKEQFIVLNEKEGKKYERIFDFVFSPDGKHLAYAAKSESGEFMVMDGKEQEKQTGEIFPNLIFSSDNRRLAYVIGSAGILVGRISSVPPMVVIDGKPQAKYACLGYPIFSPDGKQVAFAARLAEHWGKPSSEEFVVMNGLEEPHYGSILVNSLVFSSDSKNFAYVAKVGDKSVVVVNGKEGERFTPSKIKPAFSPDGKHLACVGYVDVKEGERWYKNMAIILDGKEQRLFNGSILGDPIFSRDSKRLAYCVRLNNSRKEIVVVDGIDGEPYDRILKDLVFGDDGKFVFDSPNGFHYFAIRGHNVYWVEEVIE